jgi:hypothetical protein
MAIGLRPSEALGMKWTDVDFTESVVHVRRALERRDGEYVFKETKSRTSRRSIPLPRVCADGLRAHRKRQLEERLAAGSEWQDHDLVFSTPTGHPLGRSEVSRLQAASRASQCRPPPAVRLPPYRGQSAAGPGRVCARRDGDPRALLVCSHHGHLHTRAPRPDARCGGRDGSGTAAIDVGPAVRATPDELV